MKSGAFTWFAVTADQQHSRSQPDRVPAALAQLREIRPVPRLAFERTTGDEIQCLTDNPETVVAIVSELTRLGGWRLGIGCGPVETPLPDSTRAARGPVYVAAREAVEAAATSPTQLSLRCAETVGGVPYGGDDGLVGDAAAALWLVRHTLARRTQQGWQLVDLLAQGLSNQQAAAELGISPSAASQRARAAAIPVVAAGELLAVRLLARLQGQSA